MITVGVPLQAHEQIAIEYRSISEARSEIIKRIKQNSYLDFVALDLIENDFRALADELQRIGVERKIQSTDIKLVDVRHPEFLSRVYRIDGKACYWKCVLFVILLDKIDESHVAIRVVPAFPMVSTGRGFNIHTFTFTRKWQSMAGAESDTLPLLNHMADLFQKPQIKDAVTPTPIELKPTDG
jgi:hypothetical protein